MSNRFPAEVEADVVERYRSGERIKLIAAEAGVARASVYNILDRAGVKAKRPHGGWRKTYTDDELATIKRMREAGATTEDICREVRSSSPKVRDAYRELGLPLSKKPRHDAKARLLRPDGYIYVLVPRGDPLEEMVTRGRSSSRYIAEHRLIMARHLGRVLQRHETVHHINGVRTDNRLENLQLRQGHHGQGALYQCQDCGSHNVVAIDL